MEEHDGKVRKGGRTLINLRFIDNIDALAGEEQELELQKKRWEDNIKEWAGAKE